MNISYRVINNIHVIILIILTNWISTNAFAKPKLSAIENLGKDIFFDESLSNPPGQSCATCHDPDAGFASPDTAVNEGAVAGRFGNRNAPSLSYAFLAPQFHEEYENQENLKIGGMLLDGKAKNLIDQAILPFLNPLEMNIKSKSELLEKIKNSSSNYRKRFEKLFGKSVFTNEKKAIKSILSTIVAYESSSEFGLFNSKYDLYLQGVIELSPQEMSGLKLFEDKNKGQCASCHLSRHDQNGNPPLFSEFGFDNLGVPKNQKNPYYSQNKVYNKEGKEFYDKGLGSVLNKQSNDGQFKVPTLRNIALTAPYMHNGVFVTLKKVVEFYNTRDVNEEWGEPEVLANMNTQELGDLGLTDNEVADIVVFLEALTDNYEYTSQ